LRDSGDPERPGRRFWVPKKPFFRLHAHVSMVKLPENDESGFRFWVGGLRGPRETRRDFGFPKNKKFRLHAHVSWVKLPENDKSGFKLLFGWTQDTRRDLARFRVQKKRKLQCSVCFQFDHTKLSCPTLKPTVSNLYPNPYDDLVERRFL
jgi:hypothetical protein